MTQRIELPLGLEAVAAEARGRWCCSRLEEGNILFFAENPFALPSDDAQFLLSQRQSAAGYHKTIAYLPHSGRLTGYGEGGSGDKARLHAIMQRFSQRAIEFTQQLLSPYAGSLLVDFASFRPQQEAGRQIRQRARNDLLHVDSFSTRPSCGNRILRLFTNLNPTEPRVWVTADTFDRLAERFAGSGGMPLPWSVASGPRSSW